MLRLVDRPTPLGLRSAVEVYANNLETGSVGAGKAIYRPTRMCVHLHNMPRLTTPVQVTYLELRPRQHPERLDYSSATLHLSSI